MSRMVNFNTDNFEATLSKYGISYVDAAKIAEVSDGYFYAARRKGKVNNSVLSRFHENVRHPTQKGEPVFTQMSLVLEKADHELKGINKENTDQLQEDHKLIQSLGYEKICRLYQLAKFEKENGYIGG